MSALVTVDRDGDIGIVSIDNPPVNALSPDVIAGLSRAFEIVLEDNSLRGIVLIGTGRAFCGGADIKQFTKVVPGEEHIGHTLNPLLNTIEMANKPVVAAVHGLALGGGLEMAMACHYRLAAPSTVVGQPEVKLGLIPGAGGTQRLPRLAGLGLAAEMCVFGGTKSASDAQAAGIIDEVVEGDLQAKAVSFTRQLTSIRRTRDRIDRLGDRLALDPMRAKMSGAKPLLLAAKNAMEAVAAAGRQSFDDGMATEARLFEQCLFSDQAKALIHVFFSEREVGKLPDPPREPPTPIRKVAVIGDGPHADALKQCLSRLEITDATHDADAIIEAVPDDLAVKEKVLCDAAAIARHDAILMTTSAMLDLEALAAATTRPESVIGFHFVEGSRVIEVVRTHSTHTRCVAAAMGLAKTLGKIGVAVRGYIAKRLLTAYQGQVPDAIDLSDIEAHPAAQEVLMNEGTQMLDDGLALRGGDIDIIAIHGLGFPAHLGGPMWLARMSAR